METPLTSRILKTLAGMLGIVIVAAILGFAFADEGSNFTPQTITPWPTPAPPTPQALSIEDVKARLDGGDKVVLLDARSAEDFRAGHIQNAISLPMSQFEERFAAVRDRLTADAELIAYCSGST